MVRKVAFECLKEILIHSGYSNLVLQEMDNSLSVQDKGLVTQIVYGTLQNYDFLNYQWEKMRQRRVKKSHEILINMSLYQHFYLDKIPDYAIVSEACQLVQGAEKSFIQAILFQCFSQGMLEVEESDNLKKIAIETSLPLWMIQLWKSHYGEAEAIQIAKATQSQKPTLVARINPLKAEMKKMKEDTSLTFLDDWAVVSDVNLIQSDYFKNGEIVIQDLSSQQVAKWVDPKPNQRVLDACSAPGTKTGMMAALMGNCGEIIACDIHESRLKLVEKMAKSCGVTIVKTQVMDATKANQILDEESFDRILIDAPCSGLGVLNNKPDLKFRIQPSDLDAIIQVQKEILESCAQLLKVDGILVYSTCTLNKKENERQILAFLKEHQDYQLMVEKTYFPFQENHDGFYMAKLTKKRNNVIE